MKAAIISTLDLRFFVQFSTIVYKICLHILYEYYKILSSVEKLVYRASYAIVAGFVS